MYSYVLWWRVRAGMMQQEQVWLVGHLQDITKQRDDYAMQTHNYYQQEQQLQTNLDSRVSFYTVFIHWEGGLGIFFVAFWLGPSTSTGTRATIRTRRHRPLDPTAPSHQQQRCLTCSDTRSAPRNADDTLSAA